MKLSQLGAISDGQQLQIEIRKLLTEENYFSGGDSSWTLTEVYKGRDTQSIMARMMLDDTNSEGMKNEDQSCRGMNYKLQVLTRQACCEDKNGQAINGWDMLEPDGMEIGEAALRPEWKELPKRGDKVRVKGDMYKTDPITGKRFDYGVRREMEARGDSIYRWTKYEVDSDGCINVDIRHAAQLLKRNGAGMVNPKFKKKNKKTQDGKYDSQREIINWHFKEVPPTFKKAKSPKEADPVTDGQKNIEV